MTYFIKKALIKEEFRKITNGHFDCDNPADVNRARFIAELKEVYLKMQIRGSLYSVPMACIAFRGFSLRTNIITQLVFMYVGKEMITLFYIDDFFKVLEINKHVKK